MARISPACTIVDSFFAATVFSASNEGAPEPLVAWQPNPSRRGGLTILENCIFTIIACTWSIQHLNLPAPFDTSSRQLWRKLWAAIMSLLLPEMVLAHAIVERAAAVRSLEELRDDSNGEIEDLEVCYDPWSWKMMMVSLRNCFQKATCRGSAHAPETPGLRLASDSRKPVLKTYTTSFPTIALTTRQFSFLRGNGIVKETPKLSEEEILDKSKTDIFAKGIAVLQISELILSLIARAARQLAISQLEIIIVAFAVCAVITYCFALNKPQDVKTATTIPEELVVLFAGGASVVEGAQLNRIHNGNIELSDTIMQPVSLLLTASVMVFGAIHLAAWNFTFPSRAERILWRVGSTAITTTPIPILLNAFISSRFHAMRKEDYFAYWSTRSSHQTSEGRISFPPPLPREQQLAALRTFLSTLSANAHDRLRVENFEWFMSSIMEPRFEAWDQKVLSDRFPPLGEREILQSLREKSGHGRQLSTLDRAAFLVAKTLGPRILFILGSLYLVFRLMIIILAFISLRAMPDTVYDTTWAKNIPSVQ
ncbi:hypothetical protein V8E51_002841 [Hyaloscypha variabilis]